jgi:sialic acid synthase SpsE
MIKAAAHAGADAVKFQKRTPEKAVPRKERKAAAEAAKA